MYRYFVVYSAVKLVAMCLIVSQLMVFRGQGKGYMALLCQKEVDLVHRV